MSRETPSNAWTRPRRATASTTASATDKKAPLRVGMILYEGYDSLDVLAPFQVFTLLGTDYVEPVLVAEKPGPCTSFEGVRILPHYTFDDCPPLDVPYVPGGPGVDDVLAETDLSKNAYLSFLQEQVSGATWVCSVCTGAILLGAVGALNGCDATTHWAYKKVLGLFEGVRVADGYPRWVEDGNRVTGGGISSGLDQGLFLASLFADDEKAAGVQLFMQYAPDPPFDDGDPSTASPEVLATVTAQFAGGVAATGRTVERFLAAQ